MQHLGRGKKRGKIEERTIKKGTPEWWLYIAMEELAKERKCPKGQSIAFTDEEVNDWVDRANRNLLKRLWLLIINGDIKEIKEDK